MQRPQIVCMSDGLVYVHQRDRTSLESIRRWETGSWSNGSRKVTNSQCMCLGASSTDGVVPDWIRWPDRQKSWCFQCQPSPKSGKDHKQLGNSHQLHSVLFRSSAARRKLMHMGDSNQSVPVSQLRYLSHLETIVRDAPRIMSNQISGYHTVQSRWHIQLTIPRVLLKLSFIFFFTKISRK